MTLTPPAPATDLPLVVFRDESPSRMRRDDGSPVLGRPGESAAALFWLEHRTRREHSISDMDPRWRQPGRPIARVDVQGTVEAIERAASIIPPSWRWVTLVACGWRLSVAQLRSTEPRDGGPPYLERADVPAVLPAGLSGRMLDHWQRQLRDALIRARLLDAGPTHEDAAPSPRLMVHGEPPIEGWDAIADALGVSRRTALRRADLGLPIYRQPGSNRVWAYASELQAWMLGEGNRRSA